MRGVRVTCWEVVAEHRPIESRLAELRSESPSLIIQGFRASQAPNLVAVEMVAAQTLAALKSGSALAEKRELDLLLRLAGTRQIGDAFARAGYKSAAKRLFVIAVSDGADGAMNRMQKKIEADDSFLEVPKRKMSRKDLGFVERAALLAAGL